MSPASFLHSSFLQANSAVMLWPVHVEKVPQASEHLCPARLQTRCDICCPCQCSNQGYKVFQGNFGLHPSCILGGVGGGGDVRAKVAQWVMQL